MPLFERTLHEEAVRKLFHALLEVEAHVDPRAIHQRAEEMAAIAADHGVCLSEVELNWIRFTPAKDIGSTPAFVRWCATIRRDRERLPLPGVNPPPFRMCPGCWAETAQWSNGRLLCPTCGEVAAA